MFMMQALQEVQQEKPTLNIILLDPHGLTANLTDLVLELMISLAEVLPDLRFLTILEVIAEVNLPAGTTEVAADLQVVVLVQADHLLPEVVEAVAEVPLLLQDLEVREDKDRLEKVCLKKIS